jgi:hypothetical protein
MKYDPIAEAYVGMFYETAIATIANNTKSEDDEDDTEEESSKKDSTEEDDPYPPAMKKQKIPMMLMKMAKAGILK